MKEGQVVEQGTFKELLALDGLFASMWADQVSATEDAAVSVAAGSVGKDASPESGEANEGLAADEGLTVDQRPSDTVILPQEGYLVSIPDQRSTVDLPQKGVTPEPESLVFPSSAPDGAVEGTGAETNQDPIQFPQESTSPPPLAFPSSEPESSSTKPAVTFGADVNTPRTGTPDQESEPKRKNMASQNFHRLARRISLTTRRQSSSIIPNIPGLRRESSPRVSVDDNSARDTDSATGSIKGDDKGKKKEKKDKSWKNAF